ncbi:deoxyribodipyrimidine photo-lyase [Blastococcus sp. Marseille-P5729]|uniref:cryptochrome/photolyase family protein n=1 Tax=Blastococcus sp. Marseille-P5729 TaxID=2086582 RepID=UPI000D0F0A62|nr:deoxyribodipyrimidine photo-lyase [Blastococcus sp. Marseille-P5729]
MRTPKGAAVRVMWFRRDLRLRDNPALLAAADDGPVVAIVVLDPRLTGRRSPRVRRYLQSVRALFEQTGGALVVRTGDPAEVIPAVATEAGAHEVHISREYTPYGRRRDTAVAERLAAAGVELIATGGPYAVGPGRVRNRSGAPFKVFTPYARAWRAHGWPRPAPTADPTWATGIYSDPVPTGSPTEPVGESAALARWESFRSEGLAAYAEQRNRPDVDGTSRLSVALKLGELHPRTLLAGVDHARDARFVTELAWREFYADVLWHHPASAWCDLTDALQGMEYDDAPDPVQAWKEGRTGYPIVDAGMRQLLTEHWMHNRVRMITASFLVKDLHVRWQVGARHFLDHLHDGDLASNSHGWQWTAGTGTDAAPYFRVFNPLVQGKRFDPDGGYVRRYVPELRHLAGGTVHEPWRSADGYTHGYPEPIVVHAEERRIALARYHAAR